MQVYKYDEQTKEYTGAETAMLDPLESDKQGKAVYLIPANATTQTPMQEEGRVAVWKGDTWESVEDNRGKEYWLDTDTFGTPAHTMKDLGPFPANAVFEAPQKTLAELKQDKIQELKYKRDSLEVYPIEYNGNLFDYDEKARDRINSAIIALDLMGENATIEWTTADNTNVTVTANDLRTVIANVAIRSNELHVKYRNLKERVEKCDTKEELDSIKWEDVSQVE